MVMQDIPFVNFADINKKSAIHLAVEEGFMSVIESLIESGASINLQSDKGETCLHAAVRFCYKRQRKIEMTEPLKEVKLIIFYYENGKVN